MSGLQALVQSRRSALIRRSLSWPCIVGLAAALGSCAQQHGLESDVAVTTQSLTFNTSLSAAADTFASDIASVTNYGGASTLEVSGVNFDEFKSSLVRFDPAAVQAALQGGVLQSATLELTIAAVDYSWGDAAIDVHRVTRSWVEGGATWLCANDTNHGIFGRYQNNCAFGDRWGLEWVSLYPTPYALTPTDTQTIGNTQTGVVSFDVTADLLSGTPHHGWVFRPETSLGGIRVAFSSREGSAAPRLVLQLVDECESDPAKAAPGQCGCGVADTDNDNDNDGTADCNDECPSDPNNVVPGQCGCVGEADLQPAGTACSDGVCAANTQCTGAGSCGSPAQCAPSGGNCTVHVHEGHAYAVCDSSRSWHEARDICRSRPSMDLVRIDDAQENAFVRSHIDDEAWIGASDAVAEGRWIWADTGAQFWEGSVSGSAVDGFYSNWYADQPTGGTFGNDCGVQKTHDDGWRDDSCSLGHDFVCEAIDLCPDDPTKVAPGECGCGLPEADTDGDGTKDCNDGCPWNPATAIEGPLGCDPSTCSALPSDLRPSFECILDRPSGEKLAVFSVRNRSGCIATVPHGVDNQFDPPIVASPATRFEPGDNVAVTVPLTGDSLTWRLGGRAATAVPHGPACEDGYREITDGPIDLEATRDEDGTRNDAHGEQTTPLEFEIPPRIRVTLGNAGNGLAEFEYREPGGTLVTCLYQGGSSVAEPTTDLDRSSGLHYHFVSCSNGLQGGDSAFGVAWDVSVQGADPRFTQTRIAVELGGCGLLEPPMLPADVTALRQNFDWNLQPQLPTTDSAGLPAMRYALIYLERDEQFDALRRMGVYFRAMPIFGADLEQYQGRCGVTQTASDTRGQFVYAIIPAGLYNLFRDQAVAVLAAGTGEVPFRAIALPPIPDPGIANSDGTISWQVMKDSGFRWFQPADQQPLFGIRIPIVDDVIEVVEDVGGAIVGGIAGVGELLLDVGGDIIETGLSILPTWDDIIEFGAQVLEGAWDLGTSIIGDIEEFIAGSVRVRVDMSIANRDTAFDTNAPMTRQWGADRGRDIVPHGTEAEILRWSGNIVGGARMPTRHAATVGRDGRFNIRVARGGQTRGGGLCWHLDNAAAMISSDITENEFCDFSDLEPFFNGFRNDIPDRTTGLTHAPVRLNHRWLNYLGQITDGHDYTRQVLQYDDLKQAEISVGWVANTLGALNGDRAFVGCFDYAQMSNLLTPVLAAVTTAAGGFIGSPIPGGSVPAAAVGGALGLIASPFLAKDIFLMRDSSVNRSRLTATHEYGHFVMCDVYADEAELLDLYLLRVGDGFAETRDDETGIVMESWADFFASQVASGVNYVTPATGGWVADGEGSNQVCTGYECLEINFRGCDGQPNCPAEPGGTEYNGEIGRFVTIFHDSVDRSFGDWRTASVPTNADAWTRPGATIVQSPAQYAQSRDDDVHLEGPALIEWLRRTSAEITPEGMLQSMGTTMRMNGFEWCSICELFAQHDPGLNVLFREGEAPGADACTNGTDDDGDGDQDADDPDCQLGSCRDGVDNDGDGLDDSRDPNCTDVQEIWEFCLAGEIAGIVGPPPDDDLRLQRGSCDVCGGLEISDPHGECTPCPDTERVIDNTCVPCPPGNIALSNGQCQACEENEIVVGNSCEACPGLQIADRATNTCVDCTLDAVLNLEELEGNTCTVTFPDIANGSFPGDNCPDQLWFEVRNVFDLTQPDENITVMALATDSVGGAECTGSSIPLRVIETQVEFIGGPVVRTFDYAVSGTEVCSGGTNCDPMTNPFCNPDPDCTGGVTTCRYLESLRQVTQADVAQFGLTNLIYRVVIPESSSSPPPVAISVSSRCPGPD